MSRLTVALLPLVALALTGCGGNVLPEGTDPDKGREVLTSTLDAWVSGKTTVDMKPTVIGDSDWTDGHKLTKYSIDPGHDRAGVDLVLKAKLTLQKKDGKVEEKSVMYVVGVTATQTAVMRYNP